MGCDIHIWAEVKKKYKNPAVSPAWETVGKVFKSKYQDSETPILREGYEWNEILTHEPWEGRNYDLFAILANVRNGRGFAGISTGDGFQPLDEPRGIPEDASEYYKKVAEDYGLDGHSHSWFTLEELVESIPKWKNLTTKHRGWVDLEQYGEFKKNGKPDSWSGGVSGGSVKHVSNEEMDKVTEDPGRNYFTLVEWEESYAESMGNFITETIPNLQTISKNADVLGVRIVFFFDN